MIGCPGSLRGNFVSEIQMQFPPSLKCEVFLSVLPHGEQPRASFQKLHDDHACSLLPRAHLDSSDPWISSDEFCFLPDLPGICKEAFPRVAH